MFRRRALGLLVLFTLALSVAPSVEAGSTFRRQETMDLLYGWGVSSLDELHAYNDMYPGALPLAEITFYTNGVFDALDTATGNTGGGLYEKRGKRLQLTIVPDGPFGTVQYFGRRVSPGVYEGEILVDGVVWGYWLGALR